MSETKLEEQLKSLRKKLGDDSICDVDTFIKREEGAVVVPISPALNIATNGGVPQGCIFTMSGPPKAGKTTTILHFCKKCQEVGMHVFYIDAENRLKIMNIDYLNLNKSMFHIITSSEGNVHTTQKLLDAAEELLRNQRKCVVVFDSASAMSEEREMNGEIGTETRGGGNKLMAQFLRKMSGYIKVNHHIVVMINHLMSNTSGRGKLVLVKGGFAQQYHVDVNLRIVKEEQWTVGDKEDGELLGKKLTWICEANALGAPYNTVVSYLRFGSGIDEVVEAVDYGITLEIIRKSGSWYCLEFIKDKPKFQGKEKVVEAIKENKWLEKLNYAIKELIG